MEKQAGLEKETRKIYTIGELTREIRALLEAGFSSVWVEGEVSNFLRHSSGHCYLSLKDGHSVLAAVIFKGAADKIKFKIENGMRLVCFGRISVYEKRGQYQLYIDIVEPKGIGALQRAFEQLKEKLYKEGLFDASHKKPIPVLPQKIGIVTSLTGAAIRDMLHVIERRFPNIHIILYPSKVQGEGSAESIVEGIKTFNRLNNVDVIIAGRGGGSLEDLWAFNEEMVARAIYESAIPVISAVGHEIDYTIADFAADLRAPTPSAAAEIVVAKKEDFISRIDILKQRLRKALLNKVEILKHKLDGITQRYAFKQPRFLIEQQAQRIDEASRKLYEELNYTIESKHQKLLQAKTSLGMLNPLSVLNRGYSLTLGASDSRIIKSPKDVKAGDKIKTKLAKGEIISTVE